jgi:hypothetical protein
VSYLTELLAGYRQGIARDLTESAEALQAALEGENDPVKRGTILGLLAQSLVQQDRQFLTIDEPKSARPFVTEESPTTSPGVVHSAVADRSWACRVLSPHSALAVLAGLVSA